VRVIATRELERAYERTRRRARLGLGDGDDDDDGDDGGNASMDAAANAATFARAAHRHATRQTHRQRATTIDENREREIFSARTARERAVIAIDDVGDVELVFHAARCGGALRPKPHRLRPHRVRRLRVRRGVR